jgi:hypothetical protein
MVDFELEGMSPIPPAKPAPRASEVNGVDTRIQSFTPSFDRTFCTRLIESKEGLRRGCTMRFRLWEKS